MAYSNDNKAITAFKNLLNKAQTDSNKELGNEAEGSFFNIDSSTIFTETIDSNPSVAVANGVAVLVEGVCVEDLTSNSHAFFVTWGALPSGTDPLTGTDFAYGTGSLVNIAFGDRIKNAISPAYGSGYEAKPYTSGAALIPPGDPSDWIYQYQSGIYFRQDVGTTPATVQLYVYIGKYLSDSTGFKVYDTVAEVEALSYSRDNLFVFCDETGMIYHYTNYSSLETNNSDILNTGDGGDTRYIAITKKQCEEISGTINKYINTDALEDGDGTELSPYNSFNSFAKWLENKIILDLQTTYLHIWVSGSELIITEEDRLILNNVVAPVQSNNKRFIFHGESELVALCTSVVRDVTYPHKYYITTDNFNSEKDFYKYNFIKYGSNYYPISASGTDESGNFIISTASNIVGGTLLDVNTITGIFSLKTTIKICKSRFTFGEISNNFHFYSFKISSEDIDNIGTYVIDLNVMNGSKSPAFKSCLFFSEYKVDLKGLEGLYNGCIFDVDEINMGDIKSGYIRIRECIIDGYIWNQQANPYVKLFNNQFIITDENIGGFGLTYGNLTIGGQTIVIANGSSEFLYLGDDYTDLDENHNITFKNLYLYNNGGQITDLIKYNTASNQKCEIVINNLVGSYNRLSNLSDEELSNPESQRKVVINGRDVSFSKKSIVQFKTVAQIEALGSSYPFVLCDETGLTYHYEASSGLVIDNLKVLNTADGNDSRFVSLTYKSEMSSITQVLTPLTTISDYDLISSNTIEYTPINDSEPILTINGLHVKINGDKTGACYFSNDNGITAKTIDNIERDDMLYWIGSVAGFQIDTTDYITISYMTVK